MESRNILFGIIAILIGVVIGLAIDRSNQITSLTEQANLVATQAQDTSDELVATVDAQSTELETQIDAVAQSEAEIETLSTQMAVSSTDFEEQISELSDTAAAFEVVNANLATEVAEMESERDNLATENDDLSTQVADLSSQRDELTGQTSDFATQVADLATQNDELIGQADTFVTQVAELSSERDDLTSQIETLSTQIAETIPTATPSPEPTIEAQTSSPGMTDIIFAFQTDLENRAVVDFTPDDTLAILLDDNVIEVISSNGSSSQLELDNFDGEISDFIYSSDGESIVAISDESDIVVFDSNSGVVSFEKSGSTPIIGYDISDDGNAIIVGTARSIEISVFEPSRNQSRQGGIVSLDWSDEGSQIVTTNGSEVTVFTLNNYLISNTTQLNAEDAQVLQVAFAPDGSHVAGISVDGELLMWSVEVGEIVWRTELDLEAVDDLAWSPDSEHLILVAEGDIRIYGADGSWDVHTSADGITAVDWSDDGAFIVLASTEQVGVVEIDSLTE